MSYKVCIPVAGTGSRLGKLTTYINKSLVSVANRPALSHILDAFPNDCQIVMPIGHKGDQVQEFIQLAYPERSFHFVKVTPYEGAGSGLGHSLLCCEEYLDEPFVFCSCDTLVDQKIPGPETNWMGFSAGDGSTSEYRSARVADCNVVEILDKGFAGDGLLAYIGLAGILDFKIFWELMHAGKKKAVEMGESYALQHMVKSFAIKSYKFTWHDCGNPDALEKTRRARRRKGEPNILEKANEAIWFVNGRVIKFSDDRQFINKRVQRAAGLAEYVPKILDHTEHMYMYQEINGQVLSSVLDRSIFRRLLARSLSFWTEKALSSEEQVAFEHTCLKFYKNKTEERIGKFYRDLKRDDGCEAINGIPVPTLKEIFGRVDWTWLSKGKPGRFHGDFHSENILWSAEDQKFTFLDWRQDFGGDLVVGDIYYDLAKLMHGLIISHGIIAQNLFEIDWQEGQIRFDFHRKQSLIECENEYLGWLEDNGLDTSKVITLTALIFLNIAALHHYPYCLLLYALGKSMLHEIIFGSPVRIGELS